MESVVMFTAPVTSAFRNLKVFLLDFCAAAMMIPVEMVATGILAAAVPTTIWMEIPGHTAASHADALDGMVIVKPERPDTDADAEEHKEYKLARIQYMSYLKANGDAKQWLLTHIDKAVLSVMDKTHNCRFMELGEFITSLLRLYGTPTPDELVLMEQELVAAELDNGSLEALKRYGQKFENMLVLLDKASCPITLHKQYFILKAAAVKCNCYGVVLDEMDLRHSAAEKTFATTFALMERVATARRVEDTGPTPAYLANGVLQVYEHPKEKFNPDGTPNGFKTRLVTDAPLVRALYGAAASAGPKVFCHTHGWGGHVTPNCENKHAEHNNKVLRPEQAPDAPKGLKRRDYDARKAAQDI
jgi:hypothetical protein